MKPCTTLRRMQAELSLLRRLPNLTCEIRPFFFFSFRSCINLTGLYPCASHTWVNLVDAQHTAIDMPASSTGSSDEKRSYASVPLGPPSSNGRIPVTPGVLRSIFASSRTAMEERSISRIAFFRYARFHPSGSNH